MSARTIGRDEEVVPEKGEGPLRHDVREDKNRGNKFLESKIGSSD